MDRVLEERQLPFKCYFMIDDNGRRLYMNRREYTYDQMVTNWMNATADNFLIRIYSIYETPDTDPQRLTFSTQDELPNGFLSFYKNISGEKISRLQLYRSIVLFQEDIGDLSDVRIATHNLIMPILNDIVMRVLELTFNDAARTLMLPLALTTTFRNQTMVSQDPTLARRTRARVGPLEANAYNESQRERALTALSIVAANQAGLRYFGGTEPRQLLPILRERTEAQLRE